MTLTATRDLPGTQPPPRLFSGPLLPMALGASALVTLGAFENRAVGAALPTLVEHFHSVGSFGLANAAPVATYIIALAVTGLWADRRGPVPALQAGIGAFALAQLMVGAAVSMPMVVAGRLLSGLAEGLIDIAVTVLIARVVPAQLRPRMFSVFAAMWVLPSVLGPALTGVVTEQLGWRWVFLGALALLVPTWVMLRPTLRSAAGGPLEEPPPMGVEDRRVLRWATAAAASAFGLSLAGEHLARHLAAALVGLVPAAVVLVLAVVRLLPAGTVRARPGLPAVVAVRGLVSAAFGGVGAFLPLLMTLLHGYGPATAGVSLSITGVMWAAGSWLQGREHSVPRAVVLRGGTAVMTGGLGLTTLLVVPSLSPWFGLAGWAVAGIGMGLASPSLSVLTLELSSDRDQGRSSSAAQMAGSTSTAVAFAGAGALVALASPAPGPAVFATILGAGAGCALLALLVSGRVTARAVEVPRGQRESRA